MAETKGSILYFGDVKENLICINNQYAGLGMAFHDGNFYLNFRCNLNGDANNIVFEEFPLEELDKFRELAKSFDANGILAVFDESQNVDVQIGLDVSKSVTLFFEVIDYNYEHADKLPTEYSIVIDSKHPKFENLMTLFVILMDFKKKRGDVSDSHENRFDKVEYKRPSGL